MFAFVSAAAMRHSRPPRVLGIDPDPHVLQTIAAELKGQGCEFCLGTSVDEGQRLLSSSTFDCVLVDYAVERDSRGVLRNELARYPPQTVALIVMASPLEVTEADALRSGAYDYVRKPLNPDLLRVILARAIERVSLARTLRELLEELDLANSDLQRRVDEATSELEQAHQQREEFVHMIAHELGAPLTAMRGYAEMLGDPAVSPHVQRRARTVIVAETRRLARLVQDLTHGVEFELDLGACDLAALLREQAELARAQVGERLELSLPSRPVPLLGDRDRLAQVIGNLLSNAIKYATLGTIRVALAAQPDQVRLDVIDHGPGIPPDRLEAIFEPRVRLPRPGFADRPSGQGLGLHVARQIVERHGGQIWAEPDACGGVCFSVWLPRRKPLLKQQKQPLAARVDSRSHVP